MTTPATSPADAFAAAQAAMAAGGWEAFFATITTKDLRRLASMGVAVAVGPHAGEATAMLAGHGLDAGVLGALTDAAGRITASAAAMTTGGTPDEMLARSLAHRELVKAYESATRDAVASAADLPLLVAGIERFRWRTEGGGSVSSRLFLDETLTDVVVDGKKATGTRRYANGTTDPVRFAFERGGWKISIFGR